MLKSTEYDRTKYNKDFYDLKNLNWVSVQINIPDDKYYDGCKLSGILLHDGNFISNSLLFFPTEFKVLEKETKEIKELLGLSIA